MKMRTNCILIACKNKELIIVNILSSPGIVRFKVAWLAKSVIQIPFIIMGYVVGLVLQNPELKILFQSDIRLLRY